MDLQIKSLFPKFDKLQKIHGDKNLFSIYGAGCIKNPKLFFVFMNPTSRNVSTSKSWKGIHAPWIGTKNVWKIFFEVDAISKNTYEKILKMSASQWTEEFAKSLYEELSKKKIYITNLAKCTQIDARPLKDKIFHEYRNLILDEIRLINPKNIISFGNQVSSILLNKKIKVSDYNDLDFEILEKKYRVYPVFYPVGQGMRNMPKAISRIKLIS